jgi:hypothetical protein
VFCRTPGLWRSSVSDFRIINGAFSGVFLLVSLKPPSNLDYEADVIFREEAYLDVRAARSWIPFRNLSPECYRIPVDAVLSRYVEWDERGLDGEDVDLAVFWEELLEEHGFESDRQWQACQGDHGAGARESAVSRYVPRMKGPTPDATPFQLCNGTAQAPSVKRIIVVYTSIFALCLSSASPIC